MVSFAFLLGSGSSALAGFIGMKSASRANVRTAEAAKEKGIGPALVLAFHGGSVMGLAVASLGLLGLAFLVFLSLPLSSVSMYLSWRIF